MKVFDKTIFIIYVFQNSLKFWKISSEDSKLKQSSKDISR